MKERIFWSHRFQNWYHVSSWVIRRKDIDCSNFVMELNRLNAKGYKVLNVS